MLAGLALGTGPAVAAPAPEEPAAQLAPGRDGVPVGAGSVAASPPPEVGQGVQDTLDRHLFVDPSLAGVPVPTNAWWTDLLVSRFSGDLWADPFVVANDARGAVVRYPTEFTADGTAMVLDHPVVVGGLAVPRPDPSDVLLADFEEGLPDGWTATGDAFAGVSEGTSPGQSPVSGFLGRGLLNSYTPGAGDAATGTLTSPEFTVDRAALAALVGGGNRPGHEELRLVVDGEVVLSATGQDSEALRWVTWDLTPWQGRTAHLEVVDALTAGWAHVLVDHVVLTDVPDGVADRFDPAFAADSAVVTGWGDWDVSWRLGTEADPTAPHVDVTAARGVPYLWFEFDGVTPTLTLEAGARVTGADGAPLAFPAATDRFVVEQGGRRLGVHAPAGTTFERHGDVVAAATGTPHLVLSALPDGGADLDALHATAFAVPRDTRMDYALDTAAGTVTETWSLDTEPLEGTNRDTVQGWLPHQYRQADHDLAFTGAEYRVPRGVLRTTVGHSGWTTTYAFTGLTPVPGVSGALADDPGLLATTTDFVTDYAAKTGYGGDTYWGGKDVLQLAEYMLVAKQVGATGPYEALKASLRTALTDWFTYTAGESEHFFARYDTWQALIGFAESYGSSQFTDNHFHYGYFTAAAAMLAMEDPEWAAGYGEIAGMVADQYGNGDRSNPDYPYLRTFDVWAGHSYAGGFSSPGGNNQESSSEAIQSWAGLYLLGVALGDAEMQATGAMGYVTERAAVREYWLDVTGTTFDEGYDHATTGILYDSGQAYATYFSGDPAWIYGIQWMPTGPWLNYLGWDREHATALLDEMLADRPRVVGEEGTRGGNGARVQMFAKKWWGVGTYGDIDIAQDRAAALEELKAALREVEKHHPGYATARTAANPFYDAATGARYVTAGADGALVFPEEYWTPETFPAALVPERYSEQMVDRQPAEWQPASPLLPFLSTDFTVDPAVNDALYAFSVADYEPGRDTDRAADVFSAMGDALGNVVLGMLAQSHPDVYADVFAELRSRGDAVATSVSMAGLVHATGAANRALGTEALDRHVDAPLAQVYRDADGAYAYVVANPTDAQQAYDVYEGAERVGTIDVPARTQLVHRGDAALARIVVGQEATTVAPGSTTTFTATGYDQYGAVVPLPGLAWSVDAGGTIDAGGELTATTVTERATVTARSGDVVATAAIRVGTAPRLTALSVTPGFARVEAGSPTTFTATGLDQYGDPAPLGGEVAWSTTDGAIDAAGTLTVAAPGSAAVTAALGGARGTAVVAVVGPAADRRLAATATASSELGGNTAALAVDGDPGTRWESAHGVDDVDLVLDLGGTYDLTGARLVWEGAAASSYALQTAPSADGPWSTARTVTKTDAAADDLVLDATARYLRVHGLGRLTTYGYSLYEVELTGTRAATEIAPTRLLLAPHGTTVRTGADAVLTAYAFDATGAGGPVDATWSAGGAGVVGADGRFTAGAEPGTAAVTAAVAGVSAATTVTVVANGGGTSGTGEVRDVAVGKPVTASSEESAGLRAGNAVDGDPSTRWSSAAADGEWLEVDLGEVVRVDRVELDWERAAAADYRVQARAAEGEAWTTVAEVADGGEGRAVHPADDVRARYVRVLAGGRTTGYGVSLHALEVWSAEGRPTPDLARGAAATSSSDEWSGFGPANAVDGDPGTRWASAWTDEAWLAVDLGRTERVREVTLAWEDAYAVGYVVEGRAAGAAGWEPLATVADGDGGTDVVAVDGTVREVRVRSVQRSGAFGYSLYALEVR
ncbi:discoidin domain-containing protein [Cellulomonas pakistanensis]|uniref:discoidin domain-containing protein n=1 Tax=Cellulomonas pakistanensis TaxID=992287 RepID=UPI0019406AF4|nr:discoidin domain-containing protein [Cellulomonas pakistanensis]